MGETISVKTHMKHEGGQSQCFFEGHPSIDVTGMSSIEDEREAWSPPHMLVAAVESCFFLTMLSAAEKMRVRISNYSSTAEGILSSRDGIHKEFSEIIVRPKVTLTDEKDAAKIPQLFKIAEEYCYVGRSLNTKLRIENKS